MIQWKIQRRQGACAACERAFEDGERHVSTLCFGEDSFSREDLCRECWKGRGSASREGAAVEDLFWWFTRHSPEKKRTVALDLDSLEKLFLQLEGRAERPVRELRYLLCLLLMRKRRLKVERIERGADGESFLVKRPRRDPRYRVFVFDFDEARMAELRDQLQAIFDGAEAVPDEDGERAEQDGAGTGDEPVV